MQDFGASAFPLREFDVLEDVDHLESSEALAVGRQFAQLIPVLVERTGGVHPLTFVVGEILARKGAALRLEVGDHHICQLAVVEGIAAIAPDGLQRIGKVRIAEHLAGLGCRPVGEPDLAGVVEFEGIGLLPGSIGAQRAVEIHGDDRRDRVTFAGIGDGRGQYVAHGELAEFVVHCEPRIDRAGNGDGQGADRWQAVRAIELF